MVRPKEDLDRVRTPLMAVISKNLADLREAQGHTQEYLGDMAGLPRGTVAQVEGQRYGAVQSSTLEALAQALKVDEALLVSRPPEDLGYLRVFMESDWFRALRPTEDEMRWLGALPPQLWSGNTPAPKVLADLIELKRRHNLNRPPPSTPQ